MKCFETGVILQSLCLETDNLCSQTLFLNRSPVPPSPHIHTVFATFPASNELDCVTGFGSDVCGELSNWAALWVIWDMEVCVRRLLRFGSLLYPTKGLSLTV